MSNEQLYHYNDTIDQLQQENEQLKKELAEQKEIVIELVAKCKTLIDEKYDLEYKHIMLRHEICEEIMNKIDEKFNCCGYIEDIKFEDFKKIILDQIEGEK